MKKLLAAVFVVVIATFSASGGASPFMPFSMDSTSTGYATRDLNVLEYLDFIGNSFVQNTFASATPTIGDSFTFVDNGVFKVSGVDGVPQTSYSGNEITTTFIGGTGTGILGGALTFTGGTLSFYSDSAQDYGANANTYGAANGTLIGTFNLISGFGIVDNNALPNGLISLTFQAVSLAANTWFDTAGNDLSFNPDVFNFVTTNATRLQSASSNLTRQVVCGLGGVNCPNGTPYDSPPFNFLVSNNGQDRMSTTIPEPGSLALIGIGLIGLSLLRRRVQLSA